MFVPAALIFVVLVVGILTVRRARWIFSAAAVVVLISFLSGCGGGGGGSGGGGGGNGGGRTIPGPYNFTITGTNQTTNRTITLNLQVNKYQNHDHDTGLVQVLISQLVESDLRAWHRLWTVDGLCGSNAKRPDRAIIVESVASFSRATPRKTYWYQDFFSFLPFSMFLN